MIETNTRQHLAQLADSVWNHVLSRNVYLQVKVGMPVTQLPDIHYEAACDDAAFAKKILSQLTSINPDKLLHEEQLTLEILRNNMQLAVEGHTYYWLDFPVTPYNFGFQLKAIHQAFEGAPVSAVVQRETYLGLTGAYTRFLKQVHDRLQGQITRGIRVPKAALPAVIEMLTNYRDRASELLGVAPDRLKGVSEEDRTAFTTHIEQGINTQIIPAFDCLIDLLGDEYYQKAPETVGLHQYPNGKEYYAYLVRLHTLPQETPESILEYGKQQVEALTAEMQQIRDDLGFKGSQAEFQEILKTDKRFLAQTPDDVEQRYNSYIRRIEPLLDNYFSVTPKAQYGLRRLDAEQEGSMTFGYYQVPSQDEPVGRYHYNGSDLDNRSQVGAAHLIYHELIPGHHFHLALQQENQQLPHIRREYFSLELGSFNEGWAEYTAELAGEMGLYDDPYDRYGHLIMDMFLSVRTVVDPGMNYFGWSLEQAREYMKQHLFQSDVEINSEILRYSTDMPGQALGYKIGHKKIKELRTHAEQALGNRFDIRAFHAALVGSGAMRLEILEKHIDWYIEQSREQK